MSEKTLPYLDPALPLSDRLEDLLGRMTLEEKIAQLNAAWLSELCEETNAANINFSKEKAQQRIGDGVGQITRPAGSIGSMPDQTAMANNVVQAFLRDSTRLGIPALVHEECLSGLMARRATSFPQAIGLASTWNPALVEAVGSVIGLQARSTGSHMGLAPVLDICRDPRWGRVEETYGEDPYLTARIGTSYIHGLHSNPGLGSLTNPGIHRWMGIAATGKHFAGHGMPEGGLNWAPVHVGEREFREVYLYPFEAAVKEAGLVSIMNAYHELDGVPCGASRRLLTEILRDEWGFEGIVVSDYNAIVMLMDYHHIVNDKGQAACLALKAGLDMELPATDCYGTPLLEAVQTGQLDLSFVDLAVRRILLLKFRLGLFEDPFVDPAQALQSFGRLEQSALAYRTALESMVLLKNEAGMLPLSPETASIAVIGPNATIQRNMFGDYSYTAFTALMDGGELPPEKSNFPERIPEGMLSILDSIRQKVSTNSKVDYAPGCEGEAYSCGAIAQAVEVARESQVAILVVGGKSGLTKDSTSGELRDRANLGLPGDQEALVRAVLQTGTPVVLVLVDGRPAAIPELVEDARAVLEAWLPGEQGAQAVADVLFGDYNPGGKLPISFPHTSGQVPIFARRKPSGGTSYNFEDYVDSSAQALFPFGHGLSYTTFDYQDIKISPEISAPEGFIQISLKVANTGRCAGDEVVQLYIRDQVASVTRPVQELVGFSRLHLEAGQAQEVVFLLDVAQLAFYDLDMNYVVEPGFFEVMVGSSSKDIRLRGQFEINGEKRIVEKKVFFSGVSLTQS